MRPQIYNIEILADRIC